MNNEEFQQLILQELTGINDKMSGLETMAYQELTGINDKVSGLETMVHQELTNINDKVSGLETRMGEMETRLENIENRQDEVYRVVRAIEHANQVGRSEMDGQGTRLSKVEGKLKKVAKVFVEDIDIDQTMNP